jgi:hypothetical protein
MPPPVPAPPVPAPPEPEPLALDEPPPEPVVDIAPLDAALFDPPEPVEPELPGFDVSPHPSVMATAAVATVARFNLCINPPTTELRAARTRASFDPLAARRTA